MSECPFSQILPSWIIATQLASHIKVWLGEWVAIIIHIELFFNAFTWRIVFIWFPKSKLEVGSSITRKESCCANARAIITSCCSPPIKWVNVLFFRYVIFSNSRYPSASIRSFYQANQKSKYAPVRPNKTTSFSMKEKEANGFGECNQPIGQIAVYSNVQ